MSLTDAPRSTDERNPTDDDNGYLPNLRQTNPTSRATHKPAPMGTRTASYHEPGTSPWRTQKGFHENRCGNPVSLTDARRESAAMRAAFSDGLHRAAEACDTVAEVLRAAARGDVDAERVSAIVRELCGALQSTRDSTLTWSAMETMLREVER